jgi:hypothetical protein
MLANVSPVAEPVAPHTSRRSSAGQLGRVALTLALALGGLFALARDAHAASPVAGSWSGTYVVSGGNFPGPIEGPVALAIGPGGQIDGVLVLEGITFRLVGVVTEEGEVVLKVLPTGPEESGAPTFMGTATISPGGHLLMSLSSVPFDVFQLEFDLTRQ